MCSSDLVPLVVRMKGTNEELGKKILKDSGLPIISADNMAQAGQGVVAAVKAAAAKKAAAKPKAKPAPKKAKPAVKKAKPAAKKKARPKK